MLVRYSHTNHFCAPISLKSVAKSAFSDKCLWKCCVSVILFDTCVKLVRCCFSCEWQQYRRCLCAAYKDLFHNSVTAAVTFSTESNIYIRESTSSAATANLSVNKSFWKGSASPPLWTLRPHLSFSICDQATFFLGPIFFQ